MTGGRRAATAAALIAFVGVSMLAGGAGARPVQQLRESRAVILTVDGVPFELLARVVTASASGPGGGPWWLGVMSSRTVDGDEGLGDYLTLGAGARSAGLPEPPDVGETGDSLLLRDIADVRELNRDGSSPGLLGSILAASGRESCVLPHEDVWRAHALLVAMDREGTAPLDRGCDLLVLDVDVLGLGTGRPAEARFFLEVLVAEMFEVAAAVDRGLVIVAAPGPSPRMVRAKDELTPILVGRFGGTDEVDGIGTVTSDTTRRTGLVSNEDVAPTVLEFFGIDVPAEMKGAPIRTVSAGPPFELHQRHLENRRMSVPVQVGAYSVAAAVGVGLVVAVRRRDRVRPWPAALLPAVALAVPLLGVSLQAAGRLPELSYWTVVPFVALAPVVGALAAWTLLRGRGPLAPAAAVGAAVIAYFVVDALTGWPDTPFTFLGGTALDGARFYGLPNSALGLLVGAGLLVAASLHPWNGFVVLVGLGLFAGFPDLGADIGGAVTLFAAAGLWLGLAGRGRLAWRELGVTLLTVIAGLAVVLAANAWLAERPTHGTRFLQEAQGGGLGSVVTAVLDRLSIGVRLIARAPFTALPVLGLPIVLVLALRPPPALRGPLERWPTWRWVAVVSALAGIVAYVANDTGAAAAGYGFGIALAALVYLPLAQRAIVRAPGDDLRTPGPPGPETPGPPGPEAAGAPG